jgi:hypothetical protein
VEGNGELSADEWALVARHRASSSGSANGGNPPVVEEGNGNGNNGASGEVPEDAGPPEDVFGFTDELGGLRDQFAYAFCDDTNDVTRVRGKYKPGQVAVRSFRR